MKWFFIVVMGLGLSVVVLAGDDLHTGRVGIADLLRFSELWLNDRTLMTGGDFDGNGRVDLADFARLADRWLQAKPPLIISEFMARNDNALSTILEGVTLSPDWIEIHNTSTNETIALGGMFLTDSLKHPRKWRIPPGVVIGPQEYLVFFASNQDDADYPVKDDEGYYHTNFKLSGAGEYLALLDRDGTIIDEYRPVYPPQREDFSYGRLDGLCSYFAVPTPGAVNRGPFTDFVGNVRVSVPRGFYEEPFEVAISSPTKDAVIRYTLDGSEPTANHGLVLATQQKLLINSTTVLRVAAFKEHWLPSRVETHTYIFHASDAVKSLPVVSLVGDPEKTFGVEQGLWADVMLRGRTAEFPVSFAVINPDNTSVQQNAGIRLQGSSYRRRTIGANPGAKWSFKIYFRRDYDSEGWLHYPLIERSSVSRYKSITLRGGYNDPSNPFIKDELGRRLHKDMGNIVSNGTFVNLFINGKLKNNGYYNLVERLDENMLREKLHRDIPWDVVTKWQPSGLAADPPRQHDAPYYFAVRDGDAASFAAMLDFAMSHDLSQPGPYQEMSGYLDMVNFIDYLILQGYAYIVDWPQNNWTAARERSSSPWGRWRFYAWDLEFGWGSKQLTAGFKTPPSSTTMPISILYQNLYPNRQFRELFSARVQLHFFGSGALTSQNVQQQFEQLRREMAGVLPNMNTYIRDTWAPQRVSNVLESLRQKGLYSDSPP